MGHSLANVVIGTNAGEECAKANSTTTAGVGDACTQSRRCDRIFLRDTNIKSVAWLYTQRYADTYGLWLTPARAGEEDAASAHDPVVSA